MFVIRILLLSIVFLSQTLAREWYKDQQNDALNEAKRLSTLLMGFSLEGNEEAVGTVSSELSRLLYTGQVKGKKPYTTNAAYGVGTEGPDKNEMKEIITILSRLVMFDEKAAQRYKTYLKKAKVKDGLKGHHALSREEQHALSMAYLTGLIYNILKGNRWPLFFDTPVQTLDWGKFSQEVKLYGITVGVSKGELEKLMGNDYFRWIAKAVREKTGFSHAANGPRFSMARFLESTGETYTRNLIESVDEGEISTLKAITFAPLKTEFLYPQARHLASAQLLVIKAAQKEAGNRQKDPYFSKRLKPVENDLRYTDEGNTRLIKWKQLQEDFNRFYEKRNKEASGSHVTPFMKVNNDDLDPLPVDKKDRPDLREKVFNQTLEVIDKGGYQLKDKNIGVPTPKRNYIIYQDSADALGEEAVDHRKYKTTGVEVNGRDTLEQAKIMVEQGLNPLVLDMANASSVGGNPWRAGTQEENIARRSNLHPQLEEVAHNTLRDAQNRFIHEFAVIYLPEVTVFRDNEDNPSGKPYAFMEAPFRIAVAASAAYKYFGNPRIVPDAPKNDLEYKQHTKEKLETIFATAFKQGHDSLLLSAYGCGAFNNPPDVIATLFKEVIKDYAGVFKTIVFAIYDPATAGTDNKSVFEEILGGKD